MEDKLTQRCTKCGKPRAIDHFIVNSYTENHKDLWCNACRKSYIIDINTLKRYLKANNRPFNEDLLDSSKLVAEKSINKNYPNLHQSEKIDKLEKVTVGFYLRQQNLTNNRTYKPTESPSNDNNFDVNPILMIKWGEKFNHVDYIRLEDFEAGMKRDFNVVTTSHKDYLKKICIISLKMDKSLEGDNLTDFQKLSTQYDILMRSACFTAKQRTSTDETGGLSTFSDFFRLIEEEGFIPKYVTEEEDVVDKTISYMNDYIKKLVQNDPQLVNDISMMEDKDEENDIIGDDEEDGDILDE